MCFFSRELGSLKLSSRPKNVTDNIAWPFGLCVTGVVVLYELASTALLAFVSKDDILVRLPGGIVSSSDSRD
jgi:hypothetical protein